MSAKRSLTLIAQPVPELPVADVERRATALSRRARIWTGICATFTMTDGWIECFF
jgi:hypothetical protein